VIFVPFTNGKPGAIEDFLTGFVVDPSANSKWGRPVGVTVTPDGALLVSDDGGNRIWRIRYTG
jgi:glucose/arabinose dehydrogenase